MPKLNCEVRLLGASARGRFFLCVLLVLVSACVASGDSGYGAGQAGAVAEGELAPGGQLLPLSFQVSGGLAGRAEVLDITAEGVATWTDKRQRTNHSAPLAAPLLAKLQVLLAAIPAAENDAGGFPFPGRCRDCLVYRLTLATNNKSRTLVVTSDRLAASAHRELIAMLLALADPAKRESP